MTVRKHSYGYENAYSWDHKIRLTKGKFCSIAEGVTSLLGGEHRMDWITTYPFSTMGNVWVDAELIPGHPASKGEVVIENDV